MIKFILSLILLSTPLYTNIYSEQILPTESPSENVKTYTVTKVVYLDDGGFNDELLVVLGEKEILLTIRWYTGLVYQVGDNVTIYYSSDKNDRFAVIDGNTFMMEGERFYTLK